MDPLGDSQEDFKREVDDALAEAGTREAWFKEANRRITELDALVAKLRAELKHSKEELAAERGRRERLKLFATKLLRWLKTFKKGLSTAKLEARERTRYEVSLATRLRAAEAEVEAGKRRLVDWAADAKVLQARLDEWMAKADRKPPHPRP